jgi:hypothetical protein
MRADFLVNLWGFILPLNLELYHGFWCAIIEDTHETSKFDPVTLRMVVHGNVDGIR